MARKLRKALLWVSIPAVAGVLAGLFLYLRAPAHVKGQPAAPVTTGDVFTPAHSSALSAVREFFGWRGTPVQPIAFTHQVHLQKGLQCINCHAGVDQGPDANIPNITLCMACHQGIATEKPEIQKLKSYFDRKEDVPWQRVYGFEPSAHVKFYHSPHIRAGVDCATCHGNMATQTVAVRKVNHTMGFCMDCHQQKNASTDCMTCHY